VNIELIMVYMFGPKVGFIGLEVEAYIHDKRLPGFTFIRGSAVAVLLLLNGKMILTK
jgi:hypothetical protein